eukprot:CAMPEP_0171463410 /NCGR_PEP_ID=MMETSP0945-20130129/7095_1 /TAXON_ID=109269 /ORGANISM="Vaucheria litorea, Strain CCMP2940" /LENGTH=98 /DNA_ID=CAMNT_0011990203 /DNA_START=17 /DNA_END=313 /DNA_ORIENTATION=-
MPKSGIAVGLKKGHTVTERPLAARPANRRRSNKHVKFVRSLVREVMGFAPYERRCMELLKVGKEKRVLRILRKKLGQLSRAKNKREELTEIIRTSRMK